MGQNLPSGRKKALEWIEARIANWSANPTAIGLTASSVTNLLNKTISTRTDFVSVESARVDARNATQDFYTSADDLHATAAPMVATIKGFAESSTTPGAVYAAAEVLPADPPSPIGPPAQPSIDNATLDGSGYVTINFSATGASGTAWQVARQLSNETSYTIIGNADVRTKSFVDTGVPAGTASAMYQVTGIRGSIVGPASFGFDVKFGQVVPPAAEGSQAA